MIKIENVSKAYGSHLALDHINLDLEKGEIIGLLGPNGSGKTTLIKILTGLINNYKGTVTVNEEIIGPEPKEDISYLSDDQVLRNFKNIDQAVKYYDDFFENFNREKTYQLLKDLHLEPEMLVKSLSKGMLEKFHLALALGRDADFYILDEPISGVDIVTRDQIIGTIINHINPNSTMIISTHLVDDVETILDRVLYLQDGKIAENILSEDLRIGKGLSIANRYREIFGGVNHE